MVLLEEISLLRQTSPAERRLARRQFAVATAFRGILLLICIGTIYIWWVLLTGRSTSTTYSNVESWPQKTRSDRLRGNLDCAIRTLKEETNLDFLQTANPLNVSDFVERRNRLAQALDEEGLDAFAVEPGYTFSYYANVTQPDWEVWEPEERPFLMIIQPASLNGEVKANTTFLVPSFEAERARLLDMPFEEPIQLVTYEEHWNPYTILFDSSALNKGKSETHTPTIMADEEMRDFISRGLSTAGFSVHGLGGAVERVRQTKSKAEIDILRAVNTGTVEALRAMRKCLTPGLSEDDVKHILDNTLRAANLDPFFDIVLFDENASNPHGGTNGSKRLANETLVLIDVGAHLYGYSSDICRTFFPPFSLRPEDDTELSAAVRKKMEVWDIVFAAQTAALEALHANSTAAAVDLAARRVIEDAGYGETFTHRVGHGIGIKAHESPYLHKGNVGAVLREGMVFTLEPGVYLEGEFGVRHEDVVVVGPEGKGTGEVISGWRAVDAWNP